MSKQDLMVGSVLNVTVDVRKNNGESITPAIVTRIKTGDDGEVRMNLFVILDTGETDRYNYIPLVDKQPDEIAEHYPEKVAFWPSSS